MREFHLPPSDGYLVALSGGADSRLLLELTVRAALLRHLDRPVGETVTAAHLHHGLRGAEADRDEAFCRAICDRLGVPLVVEHADVPALAAASGRSFETEAREARYGFLIRVMAERGIPALLTAHHADDQLETLLHHLLRGSGTRGMGGIPPSRALPRAVSAKAGGTKAVGAKADGTKAGGTKAVGAKADGAKADGADISTLERDAENADSHYTPMLFRPFLHWTRRDILAACAELGLDYVTDSTNLVEDCTRNRLRLSVIPALEAIAGEGVPQRTAGRLADAAREDEEALTAIARTKYAAATGGPARIDTVARPDSLAHPDSLPAVPTAEACAGPSAGVVLRGGDSLPVAAVQAEPAAIAKRMIALAYAEFYHQTGVFHRNGHRGSTVDSPCKTGADFGKDPVKIPPEADPTPPARLEALVAPAAPPAVSLSALTPDRTLSAHHLEALLALCRAGCEGMVSDRLPGDVRAEVRGGRLVFSHPDAHADVSSPPHAVTPPAPMPLAEGVTVWGEEATTMAADAPVITVELVRTTAPCAPDAEADVWASAVFPAERLPWPLLLRRREAGDVIFSHGMNKKIKKLLCDKHISPFIRDRLPLICLSDGTPLWVPGVAFRDGFPAPETGEAVRVTVRLGAR